MLTTMVMFIQATNFILGVLTPPLLVGTPFFFAGRLKITRLLRFAQSSALAVASGYDSCLVNRKPCIRVILSRLIRATNCFFYKLLTLNPPLLLPE